MYKQKQASKFPNSFKTKIRERAESYPKQFIDPSDMSFTTLFRMTSDLHETGKSNSLANQCINFMHHHSSPTLNYNTIRKLIHSLYKDPENHQKL